MEIINKPRKRRIKAAIFDFDGTISTLRAGWEEVMEPLMLEMITGGGEPSAELVREVKTYINESTGIQTALQMEWLTARIKSFGAVSEVRDLWWYKDEYNARLMKRVKSRLEELLSGRTLAEDYMITGSVALLEALKQNGAELYVASGTDDKDVKNEVGALGLSGYFKKVAGAPYRKKDCTKEAVIRSLLTDQGFSGENITVIGDGKVEIKLGSQAGALTIGTATDEKKRRGIDPVKRERLVGAGADAIIGDFEDLDGILSFMGF